MFCGSVEPIYRTILRVLQNGSVEHIVQGFCARGVPVRVCVCGGGKRGALCVGVYIFTAPWPLQALRRNADLLARGRRNVRPMTPFAAEAR
jgi:hypothetical protein